MKGPVKEFLDSRDNSQWARYFIVSQLEVGKMEVGEGLSVRVEKARGKKCGRCWIWYEEIGADPEHPTLCRRCAEAVKNRS